MGLLAQVTLAVNLFDLKTCFLKDVSCQSAFFCPHLQITVELLVSYMITQSFQKRLSQVVFSPLPPLKQQQQKLRKEGTQSLLACEG